MTLGEVLWFLCLFLFLPALSGSTSVPRTSVPHQDANIILFRDEGIYNYTTLLLREDLGVVFLGARDAVYALDINDISRKTAELPWSVAVDERTQCWHKGKHFETECRNYIRVLQKADDDRMYVCGTNAFSPTCTYMTYSDGRLKLDGERDAGKGRCPFDPFQRHSSLMLDGDLYSAGAVNFMGFDLALTRTPLRSLSANPTLRTYESTYTLNEPVFVHMDVVRESGGSFEGDDDKVYMFFSENAVEYDFPRGLVVSRVARVCKGDLGGHRMLNKRWTTFLKAHLECLGPGPSLPYIVQDVFLLQHSNWRKSIFYGVFSPQGSSDLSAVCAYSAAAVRDVFSNGRYKVPIRDTAPARWATDYGDAPDPRPGACINDAVRKQGIQSSMGLPDKTLQFVRDRPLMDEAVRPLTGGPQLAKRGPMFTRIVVDRVTALDGHSYDVMFVGTENGFVQKAVNYDGEMFIIEEVQLLPVPEPIKTLRLSRVTGQLYAGSETAAVQMALSDCSRYRSCQDCVLARDPYCAWSATAALCTAVSSRDSDRSLIQSLKDADVSMCPNLASVEPQSQTLIPGNNILLQCRPDTNLAQVLWLFDGRPLGPSDAKYFFYREGLIVRHAAAADAGLYTCQSVEWVGGARHARTAAAYRLQLPSTDAPPTGALPTKAPPTEALPTHAPPTEAPPTRAPPTGPQRGEVTALEVSVAVLSLLLVSLLLFNVWRGHLPLAGCRKAVRRCRPKGAQIRPLDINTPPAALPGHTFLSQTPAFINVPE
ncbi:semaphorin-4E-like isoform X1 [Anguilla anguilla]|uniref:semaphorin-4E-like isoform X1 n=2 Tax=Anguilla anguilla TaxID=7936 RepID=UPI0015AF7F2E|nr:semaphorin-4E-like isoform X1 [Anguilla anguilla]